MYNNDCNLEEWCILMKLTNDQIRSIICGAVDYIETEDYLQPCRFSKEQLEYYTYSEAFSTRAISAAGVAMAFETDSTTLSLQVEILPSVRRYFAFEVFVNGQLLDCLDNYSEVGLPPQFYGDVDLPKMKGNFEKTFDLGEGVKQVRVTFPWSKGVRIQAVTLDDGSFVNPVKRKKTLLAFGDSITHGMDARRPSERYIAQLADFLEADEYNKAIAGDTYCPGLAACRENFTPDYISVAYGTNDWKAKSPQRLIDHSRLFYEELSKHYPGVPVFVLTPLWRADRDECNEFGSFDDVEKIIRENAAAFPQIHVIRGYDLIPHDTSLFVEARLHPTTEGFTHYGKNLIEEIRKFV